MNDWQPAYLGRGALPRDLSGCEIEAFFTYSESERRVIDDERRSSALKLALALQIGFLRITGRFLEALRMVPPALWRHLGAQFEIDAPDLASLRTMYRRRRTLFEQQEYDEDAVGARPLERQTFHRGAAGADRTHRPDAHGGHQLAGRFHLPDRAISGPATTVTSSSKITRLGRLNGSSKRRKGQLSQRTERSLYSAGYRCTGEFRPRFRKQSTGTFATEIKGTPWTGRVV
jgi:hypothetical protein